MDRDYGWQSGLQWSDEVREVDHVPSSQREFQGQAGLFPGVVDWTEQGPVAPLRRYALRRRLAPVVKDGESVPGIERAQCGTQVAGIPRDAGLPMVCKPGINADSNHRWVQTFLQIGRSWRPTSSGHFSGTIIVTSCVANGTGTVSATNRPVPFTSNRVALPTGHEV